MLFEFTDKKSAQLLATQSRRTDISSYELCRIHQEIGKYLANHVVEKFNLKDIEISHPQGKAIGKAIEAERDILIFTFMRAGFYIADGFRSIFQNSPNYLISPKRNIGLSESEWRELNLLGLKEKYVVLIDAVINTGDSMRPVINEMLKKNAKIIVISSVMPVETAKKLEKEYPMIDFYTLRVSTNSYVGKGPTDTGNRLFGTY